MIGGAIGAVLSGLLSLVVLAAAIYLVVQVAKYFAKPSEQRKAQRDEWRAAAEQFFDERFSNLQAGKRSLEERLGPLDEQAASLLSFIAKAKPLVRDALAKFEQAGVDTTQVADVVAKVQGGLAELASFCVTATPTDSLPPRPQPQPAPPAVKEA